MERRRRGGRFDIIGVLSAILCVFTLTACQSTSTGDTRTTAELWASAAESKAELDRLLKLHEGGKSDAFPEFERRTQAAAFLLVGRVMTNCGAVADDSPCVFETLATALDPTGGAAKNCSRDGGRSALIKCAANGIATMRLKRYLKRDMQPADWTADKVPVGNIWREFAARAVTLCLAEQGGDLMGCIVTKTGDVFSVPAEDVMFCRQQIGTERRMDCIGTAAALATIEMGLAPSI